MPYELTPSTPSGKVFVELAEQHAAEARPAAAERDETARFPFEVFESMKESGFLGAMVPRENGGLGVESLRDLAIGISRLGRDDASLAIAVNMHFAVTYVVARESRKRHEEGSDERAEAFDLFLSMLGSGTVAMSNNTEPGTDLYHPMTTARRVEGGWSLTGRKSFGTLSPIADVMTVSCRIEPEDGTLHNGTATVFRGTPGQVICDNWNALGMRSSGSHDVLYQNCFIPDGLMLFEGPWGQPADMSVVIASAANLGLLGCFVGIAEAARDFVAHQLTVRRRAPAGAPLAAYSGIQHGMAELEVALASCRAHLDRCGRLLDDQLSRPVADLGTSDLHGLNAQFQCSKLVVNRAAIDVVDKAMQLSGGAGYLASSPLSRLYRDVRAGPFMQAFSPNEAYEYIGRVSLGLDPQPDL